MTQRQRTSHTHNIVSPTNLRAAACTPAKADHKNSPAPPQTKHFGEFEQGTPAETLARS
mgnify:FL=1